MFLDVQNELHKKAVLTAGVSQDVYDTGKVGGSDISIGGCDMISAMVVPTIIGAAGALTIEVIQSATSNMAAPDVIASGTFTLATTDVDKKLEVPVPQGSISKQYIAIRFAGAAAVAGNSGSAYLVPTKEIPVDKKHFAKVYPSL